MSTPPRRRSRRLAPAAAAAPSPSTSRPARLLDLPTELLVRALSRCDPANIARVAAVSLLFHGSLAEQGIRLRLQEAGYELPAQPEGESCAVRWLCYRRCFASPTRRRGRRQASGTASSSTARGGSRSAAQWGYRRRTKRNLKGSSATARS